MSTHIDAQVAHDLLENLALADRTLIQVMLPHPLCGDLSTPSGKNNTASCRRDTLWVREGIFFSRVAVSVEIQAIADTRAAGGKKRSRLVSGF
jgi:hypothetical protein